MTVDEWDYRALCSDGGCTGVIGPNGQCNVCGRAAQNWGDERKRGMRNPTDAPPVLTVADETNELAPAAPAKINAVRSAWSARELCADGGCIGVVGADGTCGVCGKAGAVFTKGTTGDEELDEEDDEEDDAEYEDDDAEEAQAEDGEDDEGDDDDDDDEDSDDEDSDDDESESDDDEEDEPDDEESNDSIHASGQSSGLASGSNTSLDAPAESLEPPVERELCSDGACVGVIGTDGLCKVCGKAKDA